MAGFPAIGKPLPTYREICDKRLSSVSFRWCPPSAWSIVRLHSGGLRNVLKAHKLGAGNRVASAGRVPDGRAIGKGSMGIASVCAQDIVMSHTMPLAPGTKLGPYEIQSLLGGGGMGEVYRARDTRLNRTVAVKILPTQISANSDFKQRFEREARTISSVSHPHICQLFDVGWQGQKDV